MQFDAIVLAGGRSSRLDGVDKALLEYKGRSLVERAVAAVAEARSIVVVGPHDIPGSVNVLEEPRFGGPSAAIAAGLSAIAEPSEWVAVVACDVPFARDAVTLLKKAATDDGVIAVDGGGQRQYLLAIYRTAALRKAVSDNEVDGLPVRKLTAELDLTEIELDAELTADIDTRSDAAALGITVRGASC